MKKIVILATFGVVAACGGTTTSFVTDGAPTRAETPTALTTDDAPISDGTINQGVSIVELDPNDIIVPIAPSANPTQADAPVNTEFASLINSARFDTGAGLVSFDARLGTAAQDYAQLMLDENHFDHVGPDGSLFTERVAVTGYDFTSLRENIAAGQQDVDSVFNAWQRSDGHRANNLATDVDDFGLGFARDGSDTRWVLILGSEG